MLLDRNSPVVDSKVPSSDSLAGPSDHFLADPDLLDKNPADSVLVDSGLPANRNPANSHFASRSSPEDCVASGLDSDSVSSCASECSFP